MRVIVSGGRDYKDRASVYQWLDRLFIEVDGYDCNPAVELIVGGARGVDTFAEQWAIERLVSYDVYRADWEADGKAAGPIRNRRMLEEGKPDLVIAFPGGRGTANMIEIARKARVAVL